MDRAPDYGSGGWGFKSLRAHHTITAPVNAKRRFIRPPPLTPSSPIPTPYRHRRPPRRHKKRASPHAWWTGPAEPHNLRPLVLSARQRSPPVFRPTIPYISSLPAFSLLWHIELIDHSSKRREDYAHKTSLPGFLYYFGDRGKGSGSDPPGAPLSSFSATSLPTGVRTENTVHGASLSHGVGALV